MKISNNALNFLLAQYRAIFKRAYIKGLASAVILTAGLAAGQAQATPSTDNPVWTSGSSAGWSSGTTALDDASGSIVTGDYDDGKTDGHNDGKVSGETLIIGASGGTIDGDVVKVSSGNAFGGYVKIGEGIATDAIAENNVLKVTSGASITSTNDGNLIGGQAKTNGTGQAFAKGNQLLIDQQTSISGGSFIGGMAGGLHGATAEDNLYKFTGNAETRSEVKTKNGNIGGLVYVGDNTHSGSSGMYQALGNTLDMSNFTVSGDSTTEGNKTFIGGWITVSNLEDNHNIELLRAQGPPSGQ